MSGSVSQPPDPDWYFEHVLADARPGGPGVVRGPAREWQLWWRARRGVDPALVLAAAQGFVLTARQASELGYTRAYRRAAIRRGAWTRAGRGIVAPLDVRPDLPRHGAGVVLARRRHTVLATGAVLSRPSDVIAGRSAAILHGLPTFAVPSTPELLAGGSAGAGPRPAAHPFPAAVGDNEITAWFGAALTNPARTLVDLGRHDRFDAIMAVDAALREELVTVDEIDRALLGAGGWPGVRQARAVLRMGDPRAESPLESVTRLRMADAGLPSPEPQVWVGRYRVDFYWRELGVVLEADGRLKYTDEERWKEKLREQYLRRRVNRVERVTWADILSGWSQTCELLRSALS